MSIKFLNAAWAVPPAHLKSSVKFTLIAICDHVNDQGSWRLKYKSLAERTCQSRRTVIDHVKILTRLGVLSVRKTRRKDGLQGANEFTVHLSTLERLANIQGADNDAPRHDQGADGDPNQSADGGTPSYHHSLPPEKEQPNGCSKKIAGDLLEIPDFMKRTPPAPTPVANDQQKGTRLATDWELPSDWADWAATELGWNAGEINRTAFRFKNHWLSTPGARGRKSDWRATWRNWCTSGLPDVRGNGTRGRVGNHGGTLTAARLVRDKDRAAVSTGPKIRF